MIRKVMISLCLALAALAPVFAQETTPRLRISLLTCGPGDNEVWEVFGHTGMRVIDSSRHTIDSDIVYNYGTFDGYGPDFELQFMRGKLLYYSGIQTYADFVQEYVDAKRSVQEQVLNLDWKRKELIDFFLKWNAEPENKFYKYDFFFDNCATRIRDIFTRPEIFGKNFRYGSVLPQPHITFRDIINKYFYSFHWTRVGVNILLGSRIDKNMTDKDIMFLPDYLRDGLSGATVNGVKVALPVQTILPGGAPPAAGVDGPLLLTLGICILTIAGLTVKKLRLLGKIMSAVLLFVTGLLGCLILVMWFGTDHQGCSDNFNILWCLPTNLIIAFARPRGAGRYAAIAAGLLVVACLLHVFRVQGLIIEFLPLLIALLCIYWNIIRAPRSPKTEVSRKRLQA